MKKLFYPFFFIFSLSILLVACSTPAPLTQESLDALNCQPSDLPKNQNYQAVDPRKISLDIFPEGQPTFTSAQAWNDTSSTRQTFSCTIFVFPDVLTAQKNLQFACNTLQNPVKYPTIGNVACQGGGEQVNLISQQDAYIVWIWADYNGKGITDLAKTVVARLKP